MYEKYLANLNWRYAVQKFDPTKKLSAEQVEFLKEVIRLSPSSYGLQPWKIYVINNPEIRAQIRAAAWDQPKITEASHLFAIASRVGMTMEYVDEYMAETAKIQNVPVEKLAGFREMIAGSVIGKTPDELTNWNARQSYLALGFLLSACAENDIDAGPMEGFDKDTVTKLVGAGADADGYQIRTLCAVGFRDPSDSAALRPKVRFSMEKILKELN